MYFSLLFWSFALDRYPEAFCWTSRNVWTPWWSWQHKNSSAQFGRKTLYCDKNNISVQGFVIYILDIIMNLDPCANWKEKEKTININPDVYIIKIHKYIYNILLYCIWFTTIYDIQYSSRASFYMLKPKNSGQFFQFK